MSGGVWEESRPAAQASFQSAADKVDSFDATLGGRANHRHQNRLGLGPQIGTVATPDLTVGRRRADRLLGFVVGCVDALELQEREEALLQVPQVLGEPLVVSVIARTAGQFA